MHNLIIIEKTGTPKELANLMKLSERSIHLLLDQLKDYNAHIRYSRSRKTYYYINYFDLKISVTIKILTDNETSNIYGGTYFLQNNLFVAI
ncbi:DNA-binding protein [Flavobacterium muglaense]|uniref:DNA-binding protein n=1 Tax=Flavobacterium muglaense TaxID=2764716 RepID=A0A923N036_9FLAO|nr:DNA-binding protein [Flavobacterium muglaense]MBC5837851.1 DNA-binding protein [Flavobacterium muglaense]MBC5844320.1 DNA-binding protein [Flavobacterium muglaense]